MQRKVLFIIRDGTLIKAKTLHYGEEQRSNGEMLSIASPDKADTLEQLQFLPGVFRNLYFIRKNLDFEIVMLINRNELETAACPNENFDCIQTKILDLFAGEGIVFDNILINKPFEGESSPSLQQETSFFKPYLTGDYDLENSYIIGYKDEDMQLAKIIGCKCILLVTDNDAPYPSSSWNEIKEFLFAGERQATIQRTTNETDVYIRLNLDGNGVCDISTGIGFFNHILEQIGKHGGIDLTIKVKGDLLVDEHHTVEDTAITLGEAIYQVLGAKRGIERYGYCLPMDDCLCTLALDFGGRSWLVWDAQFKRERVGDMPTELFSHFFKSFSDAAKMNLHIKAEGENEHHKIEGIFKALAKAIKMAVKRDVYKYNLPTTKGVL